jgi:hypothetical protein
VHELRQQLGDQLQKNADEKLRNERIAGEVQDLQSGTAAIEERALRDGDGEGRRGVRAVRVAERAGPAAQQHAVEHVDARRGVLGAGARRAESAVDRAAVTTSRWREEGRSSLSAAGSRIIEKARKCRAFLFPDGFQSAPPRAGVTTTSPDSRSHAGAPPVSPAAAE